MQCRNVLSEICYKYELTRKYLLIKVSSSAELIEKKNRTSLVISLFENKNIAQHATYSFTSKILFENTFQKGYQKYNVCTLISENRKAITT